ncbi:MAG: hypothetical protein IJP50_02950 [Paludibacteraceae bacterium]|nr:hypothetical protein [Paludibacteraceae bacterium]
MDLYEIIKKVANDLFDKVKEKLNVEQNIILAFDEGLGTRIESSDKGLTLYIGLPQTVSIIYGMNQLSEADSHKEYCKTLETPSLLSRDSVKNIDVNLIRVVLLEHILHEMGHACYQHHKKEQCYLDEFEADNFCNTKVRIFRDIVNDLPSLWYDCWFVEFVLCPGGGDNYPMMVDRIPKMVSVFGEYDSLLKKMMERLRTFCDKDKIPSASGQLYEDLEELCKAIKSGIKSDLPDTDWIDNQCDN